MSEIVVLTREQYMKDLREAAISAAEYALTRFVKGNRPAMVSRAEAAKLLGKSKATIKLMIDQQRIRTTTDGKAIPYTEIDRYLNEN
jgi:excisionase family DNA binding protein